MSLPVPARRALAALLSAGLAVGVVGLSGAGGPASAQTVPGLPGSSPAASPSASATASGSASPSASASASASPSASPGASASPTASPTGAPCRVPVPAPLPCPAPAPSASATPSASTSPTPAGPITPVITVSPTTIDAGQTARVAGTAEPGTAIELHAYSRPSTTYRVVRTATADDAGRFAFTVRPGGNTRMFARSTDAGGSTDSDSIVLTVRSTLSLTVQRTGTRTYRFSGSVAPRREGQLVRLTYRRGTGQVEAARTRVGAGGSYTLTRTFSGTGTFDFTTRTGTDVTTAGGTSPVRRTAVR